MKKSIILFIIVVVGSGAGICWYLSIGNNKNNNQAEVNEINYQAQRTETKINTVISKPIETEIANFSTTIYNKDPKRQNNITITCKALNETEIKAGETFSFCDIVGDSTIEKGYQESEIYVKGEKKMGLGGGNCQVSSTIYNAVLKIPELEVIERHEHSGHVPYVEKGKDAAVSFGAYDFKFKNNTSNTIKIVMENTVDNITAKINKIS